MTDGEETLEAKFADFLSAQHSTDIAELGDRYPTERFLRVDYHDLQDYDPTLTVALYENVTSARNALEEALRFHDAHDAAYLPHARVIIENGPTHDSLRRTSVDAIGSWRAADVRIIDPGTLDTTIETAVYECHDCGNRTERTQKLASGDLRTPTECSGCNKKRADYDFIPGPSTTISVREVEVADANHLLGYGFDHDTETLTVYGPDAGELSAGDWVTIAGTVDGTIKNQTLHTEFQVWSVTTRDPDHWDSIPYHEEIYSETPDSLTRDHLLGYVTHVKRLRTQDDGIQPSNLTEEEVKTKLVTPFLELLGWDMYGPEFRMEYGVWNGQVDYAYFQDGDVFAICEAKAGESLQPAHYDQLRGYMRHTNAQFGILTDGFTYGFVHYDADRGGPRKFLEVGWELLPEYSDELGHLHTAVTAAENGIPVEEAFKKYR